MSGFESPLPEIHVPVEDNPNDYNDPLHLDASNELVRHARALRYEVEKAWKAGASSDDIASTIEDGFSDA